MTPDSPMTRYTQMEDVPEELWQRLEDAIDALLLVFLEEGAHSRAQRLKAFARILDQRRGDQGG